MYRSKVKGIVQKKNYRSIYTLNIYVANLVQWTLVNIGGCYTRIDMRHTCMYAVHYYECFPT